MENVCNNGQITVVPHDISVGVHDQMKARAQMMQLSHLAYSLLLSGLPLLKWDKFLNGKFR